MSSSADCTALRMNPHVNWRLWAIVMCLWPPPSLHMCPPVRHVDNGQDNVCMCVCAGGVGGKYGKSPYLALNFVRIPNCAEQYSFHLLNFC